MGDAGRKRHGSIPLEVRLPANTTSETLVYYTDGGYGARYEEVRPWSNPGLPSFAIFRKQDRYYDPNDGPVWDHWIALHIDKDFLNLLDIKRVISDFLGREITLFVGSPVA